MCGVQGWHRERSRKSTDQMHSEAPRGAFFESWCTSAIPKANEYRLPVEGQGGIAETLRKH
jgi:hypothetical protein